MILFSLSLGLSWALMGCTTPQPAQVKSAIFYPEPPLPPRMQFLTSFKDTRRWHQAAGKSSFADWVAGADDKKGDSGDIESPYGIAVRDGKIYICDVALQCVHVVDMANNRYSRLGNRQQIEKPVNITIAADGTRYVCDTQKAVIAVFDSQDRFVRHMSNPDCTPMAVAVLGNELIVADVAGAEVEAWDMSGKFLRKIATKGTGPSQLQMPTNLVVGKDGRIFVTDTVASIVNVYDRNGRYLGSVGAPGDRPGFFARPKGLALDGQDNLYVADAQWEFVQLFSPTGRSLMFFGGAKPGPESMGMPAGVAIDATSLAYFQSYIDKDFVPEYLVFVTNQFGHNKIGVYAFGKSKTADYNPRQRPAQTQPATAPAATRPATQPR